jgi:hypothetical protein
MVYVSGVFYTCHDGSCGHTKLHVDEVPHSEGMLSAINLWDHFQGGEPADVELRAKLGVRSAKLMVDNQWRSQVGPFDPPKSAKEVESERLALVAAELRVAAEAAQAAEERLAAAQADVAAARQSEMDVAEKLLSS